MIVRGAYIRGSIAAAHREQVVTFLHAEIAPIMRRFPGARHVRILISDSIEEDGPNICLSFETTYDSLAAMEHAFTFPVRQELKLRMKEVLPLISGAQLFHITHTEISDGKIEN